MNTYNKNEIIRAYEVVQPLSALAPLTDDPGLVPSTHTTMILIKVFTHYMDFFIQVSLTPVPRDPLSSSSLH